MLDVTQYQEQFLKYLALQNFDRQPNNLYKPIDYILKLEGKRLRPTLTLMSCEVFDGDYKSALPAAMAIEVFHNFSLIHDDIIDEAPLRRGQETVHKKWNLNTGILSGDAMLILAYQYFENYQPKTFRKLSKLFSKTAIEVCEGQQYDIDFQDRADVTIAEYLKMIELKTAVLVGAALKMGAIVAQTSKDNTRLIYDFGLNLGLAFQLQDDYLDAFGDPATFGKQIGGDIIENKKTYLYLKAIEFSLPEQKDQLMKLYSMRLEDNIDKIETVKQIFTASGASAASQEAIQEYTKKAFDILNKLDISKTKKAVLREFGDNLMSRIV